MTLYSSLDDTQAAASQAIITYAVRTTQPKSPFNFVTGGGYSAEEHIPASPEIPQVPSWMSPDYPFVAPSEDIQGFVSDAFFSFDDPLEHYEAPIRLTRITKHSEGVYSVRFVDKNDQVVFDSSDYRYTTNSTKVEGSLFVEKAANQTGDCIYKHTTWGTYYDLLYWETELITLKMMVVKTSLSQFKLVPESAEMDARALYQYPKRVRSITVLNDNEWKEADLLPAYMIVGRNQGENTKNWDPITYGNIQLWEGYNMKFDWSDSSTIRSAHTITLSVIKGAGKGIAQLQCPDNKKKLLVTSINGVEATDNGTVFIQTDACHSIKGADKLVLKNDCEPCCKCEDMTKLGKLINQVEDEYYCLGGKCEVARGKLLEEIEKLEERIGEEESRLPAVEYTVAEGNRLFLRFRFIFRNRGQDCVSNVRATFTAPYARIFNGAKSIASEKSYLDCTIIDEASGIVVTQVGNTHTITWPGKILPGEQVYLKGLWHLQTYTPAGKKSVYTNKLTSVSYINELEDIVYVPLGASADGLYEFDFTDVEIGDAYNDFTSTRYIGDKDLDDLEKEIRQKCIKERLDDPEIMNTMDPVKDAAIIEKHTWDPRPDYYPQRSTNNN